MAAMYLLIQIYMATACTHALAALEKKISSGEEGEKLGEVCILDNVNMTLKALSNCRC